MGQLLKAQAALQRMLNSKNMNHPEVVIIYAKKSGLARMVGAHHIDSRWKYSNWTEMPEADLNGFLKVFLESKYTVIDMRVQANLAQPGMGDATPTLVIKHGVDWHQALEAAVRLHRAILSVKDY